MIANVHGVQIKMHFLSFFMAHHHRQNHL